MNKKIIFVAAFMMGLMLISCEHNIVAPGSSGNSVSFRFDETANHSEGKLLNLDKTHLTVKPGVLQKTSAYDEFKIICLDMTKFSVIDSFWNYWYGTNQPQFFDYTLWDSTKDDWDNVNLLIKRYTGNAFEYIGEYTFSISDSVARGTVFLNEGLNYFIYGLRSGGITGYWSETYAMISQDSSNTIHLDYQNQPPRDPSSPYPSDGATGVILDVQLTWQTSDPENDPLTYNVYFGPSGSTQLVASGLTVAEYDPGQLQPNTLYAWWVEALDSHGNYSYGFTWYFTTGQ